MSDFRPLWGGLSVGIDPMPIKLLKNVEASVHAENGIISKSGISASQQRFFEFEIDPQRRRPSFDLVPAPPPGLRPLSRSPPLG